MLTKYTDIVFDLGGVVLDIDRDRCVRSLESLGLSDASEMLDLYRQSGEFLLLEEGNMSAAGFFDYLRDKCRKGVTDLEINDALCSFIVGLPLKRLKAFRWLRSRGKKLYVLSNTNPIMYNGIIDTLFRAEGLSIRDYFDGEIVSFQEKVCKPEPGIYEILKKRFALEGDATLFLDDSAVNCEAAESCGINAALVAPGVEFADILGIPPRRDEMRQNAQNIIHGRPNPESGLTATVGTFDGVHTGHRYLLEELKRQAAARDSRPVAIVIDPHPLQIVRPEDAPPLLSTFDERRRAIESEGVEVFRLEFNERTRSETSDEFIAKIHDEMGVKTLLVGYDNRFGSDRTNGIGHYREAGRKVGLEVIETVCLPGVSSSAVRKRLLCGDIEEGNRLLGYRYGFTGLVVGGARLGRRLGFPTANLNPVQPERLIPPAGVYATLVRTDETGDFRPSMTNIGHRPTVAEEDAPLSIETHIFDYEGDLYGRPVQVRFVSRLRDEKRFASVDELKAQLKADSADALAAIQNGKTI